ncbi:HlyD family secretion protein [Aneurinibacillus tyrosinisolvens]|uniref:HlyD family secretion protein n=1 Tax=Aneurinibacillus tyrosinisolvens TaxID=1443435 RepID=UPI00063F40F6|nr:HlyD family efflux transporter periplasmic adaptor subunit [Aneurinibacillus tyrosinisolvens]
MNRARVFLVNIITFIIILGLIGGGYYYFYMQSNYITTDNAKVMGDIVSVSPQSAGKVTGWKGKTGTEVKQGDVLGQVTMGNQNASITSPANGTVVQSKVTDGQIVSPGQPVAQVVDMKNLYITANIDETDMKDLKKGADVTITVDAESGTDIKGKVEEVGLATNSIFSLLPQQNSSGDYTKVTQNVPVRISMDSYPADIVPGMNVTVEIDK